MEFAYYEQGSRPPLIEFERVKCIAMNYAAIDSEKDSPTDYWVIVQTHIQSALLPERIPDEVKQSRADDRFYQFYHRIKEGLLSSPNINKFIDSK